MNHYLLQYDFSPCLSYSCVEVIWNQLLQAINSAVDLFVPKGYLKVKQFPKWFTPALKHELNYIHTFRREFSVWFTQSFKDKLSAAEAHLLESMMEAKFTYELTLINSFANFNSNKIYKYISDVFGYHCIPNFMYLDNVSDSTDFIKAQLFNRYLYSVFSAD